MSWQKQKKSLKNLWKSRWQADFGEFEEDKTVKVMEGNEENNFYINFDEYIRQGEPEKKKRADAWA